MNVSTAKKNDYVFNLLVIVIPQIVLYLAEALNLVDSVDVMTRLILCFVSLCSVLGYYLPIIIPASKQTVNKQICILLPYIYVALTLSAQVMHENRVEATLEKEANVLSSINVKRFGKAENSKHRVLDNQSATSSASPEVTEPYFIPNKNQLTLHEQFSNILLAAASEDKLVSMTQQDKQVIADFSNILYDFMLAKDWQNFLEHTQLHSHLEGIVTISLTTAVASGAPIELVHTLINMGGEFSPVSLTPQFGSGDLEYIQSIENLGVNLTGKHAFSMSLVDISLMVPTQPNVFDYVMQQNLQYISDYNEVGLDPIGMAIVNARVNQPNTANYIKTLHDSGAAINSHHQYLMALLKNEDEQLYEQLISATPSLAFNINQINDIKL